MIGSSQLRREKFVQPKFQFHYGMIGSGIRYEGVGPLAEFQFHYGMIGSICIILYSCGFLKFQFHYGMIGRIRTYRYIDRLYFVSIPLWDDWKRGVHQRTMFRYPVSIPLWDDWKLITPVGFYLFL